MVTEIRARLLESIHNGTRVRITRRLLGENMQIQLNCQLLLPDDPEIDNFDSGNAEVNDFFKRRKWFNTSKNTASPPTYRFTFDSLGANLVGMAAIAFKKSPHPNDSSRSKALYLVIYALGIDLKFQGQKVEEKSCAAHIFDYIEQVARAQEGSVGVSLWVRADNPRAIKFYERVGMATDPGTPHTLDDGAPHLTMRKVF